MFLNIIIESYIYIMQGPGETRTLLVDVTKGFKTVERLKCHRFIHYTLKSILYLERQLCCKMTFNHTVWCVRS